jgi:hypothetical protein
MTVLNAVGHIENLIDPDTLLIRMTLFSMTSLDTNMTSKWPYWS